jgi:hypothetical protein
MLIHRSGDEQHARCFPEFRDAVFPFDMIIIMLKYYNTICLEELGKATKI